MSRFSRAGLTGEGLSAILSAARPGGRVDLRIQAVLRKAIIAVDEKGTTASAATGVSVGMTSVSPTLVVNRPFLFFVRHNPAGAILFQGRVVDPSK